MHFSGSTTISNSGSPDLLSLDMAPWGQIVTHIEQSRQVPQEEQCEAHE
jgi:hypothetical protein